MKIIFTFLCISIFSVTRAQVTITTNDMPVNGHIYTYSNAVNDGSVDVTNTGANMTWDFSQLAVTGQSNDTIVGISQMPFAYQLYFFGSDQSIHAGNSINLGTITIDDIWNVYDKNTGDYSFSGYGGSVSGFPTPFVYSPKDRLFALPMNFGNVDSSTSNFNVNIPTVALINQDRKRINEVDGWGTVITPLGSFSCLRVKSTILDHDSLSISAIPFPIPGFDLKTYEYKWVATGGGEPIVQVNASDVFGSPQITAIKYQDTLITTQIKNTESVQPITIYPSLANQGFFILANTAFTQHPDVFIYSSDGRQISHITQSNGTVISVDTHNWAEGIYFIQCNMNGSIEYTKVVVAH